MRGSGTGAGDLPDHLPVERQRDRRDYICGKSGKADQAPCAALEPMRTGNHFLPEIAAFIEGNGGDDAGLHRREPGYSILRDKRDAIRDTTGLGRWSIDSGEGRLPSGIGGNEHINRLQAQPSALPCVAFRQSNKATLGRPWNDVLGFGFRPEGDQLKGIRLVHDRDVIGDHITLKARQELIGRSGIADQQHGLRVEFQDVAVTLNAAFVVEKQMVPAQASRPAQVGSALSLQEGCMVFAAKAQNSSRLREVGS